MYKTDLYITPNDEGVMSDSDSMSIQKAIWFAKEQGLSCVLIPHKNLRTNSSVWVIDKTILLPSDITIILENAHLRLADDVYENIFRNENCYTDVSCKKSGTQNNIHIIGVGKAILDGGKPNDLREATSRKDGRPHVRFNNLILFTNVCDYSIENLSCINMRWWAINQIFCKNGYINRIHFFNGELIPNQDGINVRIGCSNITIENITGRTGDDTIALSAFPDSTEAAFKVEGSDVDIHHINIRNVHTSTRQTIVALRNQDGAKMYSINIENISDSGEGGGLYTPWGVVKIGENNYYKNRLSTIGETYNIRVRGVSSLRGGTIFLGATLKNSHISDVYAGGNAVHAISTFQLPWVPEAFGYEVYGGVTLENVVFENIYYNGKVEFVENDIAEQTRFIFEGESYPGAALDFRMMSDENYFKNVAFRNIYVNDEGQLITVKESMKTDIESFFK